MHRFSLLILPMALPLLLASPCSADPAVSNESDAVPITQNDKAAEARAVEDKATTPEDYQQETLSNPYTNSYAQMNAINKSAPGANAAAQVQEGETGKVDSEAKLINPDAAKKKVSAIVREKVTKGLAAQNAAGDTKAPPPPVHRAEDSLLKEGAR